MNECEDRVMTAGWWDGAAAALGASGAVPLDQQSDKGECVCVCPESSRELLLCWGMETNGASEALPFVID